MTGIKKIEVYYHNDLVRYLAETPNRLAAFQYADSWLRNGFSISPLSLPLNNTVFMIRIRPRGDPSGGSFICSKGAYS